MIRTYGLITLLRGDPSPALGHYGLLMIIGLLITQLQQSQKEENSFGILYIYICMFHNNLFGSTPYNGRRKVTASYIYKLYIRISSSQILD